MSETANLERRKNERRRPPSLIYVELNASNGGMMRDLSEDGFALRAMMPLTVGDGVGFSFVLHGSIRIEGEGEVMWVEGKGRVAGVCFTNISSHDREEIQSWLSRIPEMHNGKETEGSTAEPSRRTWNELREELLSSPSSQQSAQPWDRETVGASDESRKWSDDEEHEHKDPIQFPGPPSGAPAPAEHAGISLGRWPESKAAPSRVGGENSHAAVTPALPDISKILMQPPSKASNYPPKPFEPLDPLSQTREMTEKRGGWFTLSRAVVIMSVLAVGVGAFAYHEFVGEGLIWLGQQVSGPQINPPQPSAPSVPAATAPAASESSPSTRNTEATAKPADVSGAGNEAATSDTLQSKSNTPAVPPDNDVSPALPPVAKHAQAHAAHPSADDLSASTSGTEQKLGMTEYSEAVRLLHGPRGTADPGEAARLLWIAVEKGNSDAELALAELYWHGEGVARNCDQARILLGAAVRKGNLAARTRLSEFEREGCR